MPYTGEGPTAQPDGRPPDDYSRLDVNPDMFGADVARGMEKVGEGVQQAQKFWGEVQTSKSLNDALTQGDAVVENYRKLNGQDALNAQDSTRTQLQQIIDQGRANLSSPQQQLDYDKQVRGYQQRLWNGQMATHALDQARSVSASTNNDTYKIAVNQAATSFDSPDGIRGAWDAAYSARLKQLQYEGTATPEGQIDARNQAGRDVYKTAAQAMGVKDPVRAAKFVEDNREILGAEYAPLADGLHSRALDQGARDLATSSRQAAEQASAGAPTSPARAEGAPLPTFAAMPVPGQQGGAAPAPAPNGLPQTAPLPPARGDGGPAPSADAGTTTTGKLPPVSDSSALMASQRIALGREASGDRALLARYHEEQGTPQDQRNNALHLPAAAGVALPPPRDANGQVVQPAYAAWRATLSKADRVKFDDAALRNATKTGTTLPQQQAAAFQRISDRASAKGETLPGGAPVAALPASAAAAPPAGVPSKADYDAATARTRALSAPGHVMSQAEHDQFLKDEKVTRDYNAWRATQPVPAMTGGSNAQSYPTTRVNPATGRADTSGAPEIDPSARTAAQPAPAAAPAPAPQPQQPPGQNRDTSPTPVAHPSTMRLPAAPAHDAADTSTSLPKPIGGSAAMPYFTQAGAPYGISGNYLARTKQIESGSGNGNVTSKTGAMGPFQFIPSTWAKYGNGGNPYDFNASTMAAVRLAADNKAGLTRALGRVPDDAELYLAHQQGLAGAAALLRNPNMAAADALAPAYQGSRAAAAHAIAVNGGNPEASAGVFAQMWINKFNGVTPKGGALPFFAAGAAGFQGGTYAAVNPTPFTNTVADSIAAPPAPAQAAPAAPMPSLMQQAPAAPQSQQAPAAPQIEAPQAQHALPSDTYARIAASDASPEMKARAFAMARQQFAEDDAAAEQTNAAKKARSEKARDGYIQRLMQGDTAGLYQQVARDPNLEPETRWTLGQAIEKRTTDMNGGENPKSWGPGFGRAYERLMLPPGDPNRLQSSDQIYHLAGQDGGLSLTGAAKLDGVFKAMQRSADDHSIEVARASVLKAMHTRMSFESPELPIKDRPGEAAYNEKFVPQYMAGFDKWVKSGKDPMDYIQDTKSAEALAERLRPRRQMEADRILATKNGGEVPENTTMAPNPFDNGPSTEVTSQRPAPIEVPPAPTATDPTGWARIMSVPPETPKGKPPYPPEMWARMVTTLAANPTPETIQQWNESKLGRAGYKAEDILKAVRPDAIPDDSVPFMAP